MAEAITVSGPVSGTDKALTLSTGVFAPQSQGSVVASIGDTQALATANGSKDLREYAKGAEVGIGDINRRSHWRSFQ